MLSQDGDSLLAAIAQQADEAALQENAPPESSGPLTFHIDRDWWLFRHIMSFLRDGILPDNDAIVVQLHDEAAYYRLHSLRRAIRQRFPQAARGAWCPHSRCIHSPRAARGASPPEGGKKGGLMSIPAHSPHPLLGM